MACEPRPPFVFNLLSDGFHWILLYHFVWLLMSHYLDDLIMIVAALTTRRESATSPRGICRVGYLPRYITVLVDELVEDFLANICTLSRSQTALIYEIQPWLWRTAHYQTSFWATSSPTSRSPPSSNAASSCNHTSSALVTALAFHHVRLETLRDPSSFTQISASPKLSAVVREPSHPRHRAKATRPRVQTSDHHPPREISYFTPQIPHVHRLPGAECQIHRGQCPLARRRCARTTRCNIQLRVLSAVLDCSTGHWSEERNEAWEAEWMGWYDKRA